MRKIKVFWLIFVCSLLIRSSFVLIQNHKYPDIFGFENGFIASNLVSGVGYSMAPHSALPPPKNQATAHKMPGYPFILAFFMKIFPYKWKLSVQFFQAFLCAISAYFVYMLGLSLGKKSSVGWISLGFFTFSPFLGAYFTYIETTAISALLILLFFNVLLRPLSLFRILQLGILYGVNLLVYPSTFLLIIPMSIKIIFESFVEGKFGFVHRRRALYFALFLGLSLLMLSPWIIRNYKVFNKFVPLTSTLPQVIYIGNYEAATGGMYDKDGIALKYDNPEVASRSKDEVEFFANLGKVGLSYTIKHPMRFVRLRVQAFAYFWTSQAFWLKVKPYTDFKFRLYWILTSLMLLGAMAGWVICFKENAFKALIFGSLFLSFGLFYSMCIADIGWRFRAPLDPLLLIFCGITIERLGIWLSDLILSISMKNKRRSAACARPI